MEAHAAPPMPILRAVEFLCIAFRFCLCAKSGSVRIGRFRFLLLKVAAQVTRVLQMKVTESSKMKSVNN